MNYYTDVLKKYAVFSGRARRKEYWMFFLFNTVIELALGYILAQLGARTNNIALIFLAYVYALAVIIPSIAVTVRRLHDVNQSGWLFLVVLIPLIGWIILLVFTLMDSNPGDNQYGPNPKGMAAKAG
jgi:uncharacterized membrane protein YhaH (DUF805 family)